MSVRFKNARVEKLPLNIRIQWIAGTACVSECVLKTLACRGLRVGPSKYSPTAQYPLEGGLDCDTLPWQGLKGPLWLGVHTRSVCYRALWGYSAIWATTSEKHSAIDYRNRV